jgi:hypothetical protein
MGKGDGAAQYARSFGGRAAHLAEVPKILSRKRKKGRCGALQIVHEISIAAALK